MKLNTSSFHVNSGCEIEGSNDGDGGKAMANYPQELAQDAVCRSHTGHMTGLWFLPARPLRLNTNE